MPRRSCRAAALLAALALTACGGPGGGAWSPVGATPRGGVLLQVRGGELSDQAQVWRFPPPGRHCAVYHLVARSVDGGRHELRAADFRAGGGTAAASIAHCNAPQLQPTWVGATPVEIAVTVLVSEPAPPPLEWSGPST